MLFRRNKLTEKYLLSIGFEKVPNRATPAYRKSPNGGYAHQIQVTLYDYHPATNPNCGIVSIYIPPMTKISFTNSGSTTNEETPAVEIAIAWYVSTIKRLNKIYDAITQDHG